MSLLDAVHAHLREQNVPHALIGAMAMASHGAGRASLDADLLAVEASLLEPGPWSGFTAGIVDRRPGGAFDPLAGVVRIAAPGEVPVDIVLFGPHGWQAEVLQRATGSGLRLVTPADLVLMKLFAGGPRDRADVHALLDLDATIRPTVDARIGALPARARALWSRLLAEREGEPG
ncbi:MAG: hypothetical protein R3F61_10070 [Myxococcota bacterium]